jgi:hypothetical protein
MKAIGLILGVSIVLLGAIGIIWPGAVIAFARHFETTGGLYEAAAIRIGLGITLLVAAGTSRAPGMTRLLGVVLLMTGSATPFIGAERTRAIVDWWSSQQQYVLLRAWAGVAIAFGCFVVWSVGTKPNTV